MLEYIEFLFTYFKVPTFVNNCKNYLYISVLKSYWGVFIFFFENSRLTI